MSAVLCPESATLTRDADGRITQAVEDQNGVTTTWGYTYDACGRLASVSENGSVIDSYGYDGNGNRVSVNGQTIASYNADDQLTRYNGVAYTYAADGSLAGAGSTTYQYDALGHLLEVKTPSETNTYTYAAFAKLGPLVHYDGAKGQSTIAVLAGKGRIVTANYVARAVFAHGSAEIDLSLIREQGHWKIDGFHVNSPSLL